MTLAIAPAREKFTGRLRHCQGMYQTVYLILGVTAAVATALLMGLIARDNIGMPPDMVRDDALIAASSSLLPSPGCHRGSTNSSSEREV